MGQILSATVLKSLTLLTIDSKDLTLNVSTIDGEHGYNYERDQWVHAAAYFPVYLEPFSQLKSRGLLHDLHFELIFYRHGSALRYLRLLPERRQLEKLTSRPYRHLDIS